MLFVELNGYSAKRRYAEGFSLALYSFAALQLIKFWLRLLVATYLRPIGQSFTPVQLFSTDLPRFRYVSLLRLDSLLQ